MSNKVKLTKQKLKEDKFTTSMLLARGWLQENWQVVAIGTAIVIVVIISITYFSQWQSKENLVVANRLGNAITELRQQNYETAIEELKAVVEEGSGHVASLAAFHLGNAYYEIKNYDEAIDSYQRYIDKYHDDKLTTVSAIAGVASCLEIKQDFQTAGDKFLEAVEYYTDSPDAPDYLLGAVRNYVNAGNKEKVDQCLNEMKEKYSGEDCTRIATMLAMKLSSD